jgi:hypothetical protein
MVDRHGLVHGLKMSPWATTLEKIQKMIVILALTLETFAAVAARAPRDSTLRTTG